MTLVDGSLKEFLIGLGSSAPVPGGGSASAVAAALAARLYLMVVQVTLSRETGAHETLSEAYRRLSFLAEECERLVDADAEAYQQVRDAYRLPRLAEEDQVSRAIEIENATRRAAGVPMELAQKCLELLNESEVVARVGRLSVISDVGVGNFLALSAVMGGLLNVEANLPSIKDEEFVKKCREEMNSLQEQSREAFDRLQQVVMERMNPEGER